MEINNQKLKEWTCKISEEVFARPFKDEVVFNHRLRTTGGRYIPAKRVIELNPKYLKELDQEEFIGIIKHELCHYHLHIEGKGYKHRDRDFRRLMKETGSPRFCKPLPSHADTVQHYYICTQCGQEYYRKRKVNTSRYSCGKCRGKLLKKEINH
ncbi:SprT family protein [Halobacillus salinarum]|uniref:Protein SprT-like n=1 Tax=Halobacillus salinarum TaxID=2932257 RepID=A0ABY4EJT2_9BACI|nr:SprT family protein [Halobacillus salinarum]UOQ44338.1 SprT family protein [Halobacillus salinarum]